MTFNLLLLPRLMGSPNTSTNRHMSMPMPVTRYNDFSDFACFQGFLFKAPVVGLRDGGQHQSRGWVCLGRASGREKVRLLSVIDICRTDLPSVSPSVRLPFLAGREGGQIVSLEHGHVRKPEDRWRLFSAVAPPLGELGPGKCTLGVAGGVIDRSRELVACFVPKTASNYLGRGGCGSERLVTETDGGRS